MHAQHMQGLVVWLRAGSRLACLQTECARVHSPRPML